MSTLFARIPRTHAEPISNIHVGERCRNNIGNIDSLAESIGRVGLLHPIVVRWAGKRYELVAGERRLVAVKQLGWKEVPIRVADSLNEAVRLLEAERDENECREPLSPLASNVLYERLKTLYAPAAKQAQEEGGRKGGETAGRGRPKKDDAEDRVRETSPKPNEAEALRPRTKAAAGTDHSFSRL